MYWKQRGNHRYLYKAVRVDGRPHRIYVGTGADAEAALAADRLERLERQRQREQLQAYQQQVRDTVVAADAMCQETDNLTRAALLATGFHAHRSQWRRKRHANQKEAIR